MNKNGMNTSKRILSLVMAGSLGLASVARAQVTVVSDTADNLGSQFVGIGNDMAETFGTGVASGQISQITLSLDFAGATQTGIFLYTTSGAPLTYETLQIGTVSTNDYIGTNSFGQNLYNVELNPSAVAANPLAAGTDYSLGVEGLGGGDNLYWNYTADGSDSTGTGSFLGAYYVSHGSWVAAPSQMQGMEIDLVPGPVPEPGASALMMFGAIGVALIKRKGPMIGSSR